MSKYNIELPSGSPLTYDWFGSVVKAIKQIDESLTDFRSTNNSRQRIFVSGKGKDSSGNAGQGLAGNDVNICAGSEVITLAGNRDTVGTVTFPTQFKELPIVTLTLADENNNNKNPPYATIAITEVRKNKFSFRVNFVSGTGTPQKVGINYIAIGRRSSQ